jgi:hypothetical protein
VLGRRRHWRDRFDIGAVAFMTGESVWRYYFPDDGETAEDARQCKRSIFHDDAEDVARRAAEQDFSDGGLPSSGRPLG